MAEEQVVEQEQEEAEREYPVTLVHELHGEREVNSNAQYNQAMWDGFGPDPREGMTPQQKAALTRAGNKAKVESSSSAVLGAAASGGTAAGEKTVGTNPS